MPLDAIDAGISKGSRSPQAISFVTSLHLVFQTRFQTRLFASLGLCILEHSSNISTSHLMVRRQPHPDAIFSLIPTNDRAKAVLDHSHSRRHVSLTPSGIRGLNIGLNIPSKSRYTLATLGRNDADIMVENSDISRTQCSFEIQPDTGCVMPYDQSNSQSTQVYGPNATPFESGRNPRRVVLPKGSDTVIVFGGAKRDLFLFRISWHHSSGVNLMELINDRDDHPQFAQTVEETPTSPTSLFNSIAYSREQRAED